MIVALDHADLDGVNRVRCERGWGRDGEPPGAPADADADADADANEFFSAHVAVVNADVAAAEALLPSDIRRSDYAERSEGSRRTGWARGAAMWLGGLLGRRRWRYSSSSVTFLFCLDRRCALP